MKYFNNQEGKWIPGKSYRKKVLLENIKGKINIVQDVIIEPFGEIPPHKHRFTDEVFYIIKGELIFKTEKESIQLGPGDLIFVDKEESHSFINKSQQEARLICLKINYKEGDSYLD